jgi:hypothetical protein
LFNSILNSALASPLRLNPDLPLELERITSKALEKDREVRYRSAAELRAGLKRLKRDTTSGKMTDANLAAVLRESRGRWIAVLLIPLVVVAGIYTR